MTTEQKLALAEEYALIASYSANTWQTSPDSFYTRQGQNNITSFILSPFAAAGKIFKPTASTATRREKETAHPPEVFPQTPQSKAVPTPTPPNEKAPDPIAALEKEVLKTSETLTESPTTEQNPLSEWFKSTGIAPAAERATTEIATAVTTADNHLIQVGQGINQAFQNAQPWLQDNGFAEFALGPMGDGIRNLFSDIVTFRPRPDPFTRQDLGFWNAVDDDDEKAPPILFFGHVKGIPVQKEKTYGGIIQGQTLTLTVEVSYIMFTLTGEQQWIKNGELLIKVPADQGWWYSDGEPVEIMGVPRQPPHFEGFDYPAHLLKQGIHTIIDGSRRPQIRSLAPHNESKGRETGSFLEGGAHLAASGTKTILELFAATDPYGLTDSQLQEEFESLPEEAQNFLRPFYEPLHDALKQATLKHGADFQLTTGARLPTLITPSNFDPHAVPSVGRQVFDFSVRNIVAAQPMSALIESIFVKTPAEKLELYAKAVGLATTQRFVTELVRFYAARGVDIPPESWKHLKNSYTTYQNSRTAYQNALATGNRISIITAQNNLRQATTALDHDILRSATYKASRVSPSAISNILTNLLRFKRNFPSSFDFVTDIDELGIDNIGNLANRGLRRISGGRINISPTQALHGFNSQRFWDSSLARSNASQIRHQLQGTTQSHLSVAYQATQHAALSVAQRAQQTALLPARLSLRALGRSYHWYRWASSKAPATGGTGLTPPIIPGASSLQIGQNMLRLGGYALKDAGSALWAGGAATVTGAYTALQTGAPVVGAAAANPLTWFAAGAAGLAYIAASTLENAPEEEHLIGLIEQIHYQAQITGQSVEDLLSRNPSKKKAYDDAVTALDQLYAPKHRIGQQSTPSTDGHSHPGQPEPTRLQRRPDQYNRRLIRNALPTTEHTGPDRYPQYHL